MVKKKWMIASKRADFKGIGQALGIDPVLVRIMRNRDLTDPEEMRRWLYGDLNSLHDPHLLKDIDKAAEIILHHIKIGSRIMIANDFDCDGISAGFILKTALKRIGADVYVDTPDRITDGYGINVRMVEDAAARGTGLIITCDNGIAAMEAADKADELGIELIITDHHEVPYEELPDGGRRYILPRAAAVVDPKQTDCPYPFDGICGAVVAFKLMQVVYEKSAGAVPNQMFTYLEIAAMATVADVMQLKDENRILVKYGLERMKHTDNKGLQALMEATQIRPERLSAYHIGFIIGPCLNASGRLSTAQKAISLLEEKDYQQALIKARELKDLNDQRKDMTQQGVDQARDLVEASMTDRKVLVIPLKDCHESIAGIIAGRIREIYNRPVIVLTDTGTGYKGSGRSIPAYNMFERVSETRSLLSRFGGHAMACGLSLPYENLETFSDQLEEGCGLTDKDLVPVVNLDLQLPVRYLTEPFIESLDMLAPYGMGNPKPLFAEKDLSVSEIRIMGQNRNVLKLRLRDNTGWPVEAIYFGDIPQFEEMIREKYGDQALQAMYLARPNPARLLIAYEPEINEFRGSRTIQLELKHIDVQ